MSRENSNGPSPNGFPIFVIDREQFNTCIVPIITELSKTMIRLYGHYKNNFLPFSGGILDQPEVFVRSMEIIDARINELNERKAEKNRNTD